MDNSNQNEYKLWGGRFENTPNELMKLFNNSLAIDKRIWREDIFVNLCFYHLINTVF
jgi:argininosuccinate lyase